MSLHDAVSTVSQPSSIPYQTRSDSSSSSSSLSSGLCSSSLSMFAVGIACGAAASLLLSSTRGSQLRNAVRDYASQGSERLQQIASSSIHWAEDSLQQAMSALEEGRRAFSRSQSASSGNGSIGSLGSSASSRTSSSLTASIGDRSSSSSRSVDDFSGI